MSWEGRPLSLGELERCLLNHSTLGPHCGPRTDIPFFQQTDLGDSVVGRMCSSVHVCEVSNRGGNKVRCGWNLLFVVVCDKPESENLFVRLSRVVTYQCIELSPIVEQRETGTEKHFYKNLAPPFWPSTSLLWVKMALIRAVKGSGTAYRKAFIDIHKGLRTKKEKIWGPTISAL